MALSWGTIASAATITVTTSDDELNNDGDCSLREAVAAANTDEEVDNCEAGEDGPDDIVFSPILALGTISLGQQAIAVTDSVSVDGGLTAGSLTISGDFLYRIFVVRDTANLALSNLTLIRGRAERGGAILVAPNSSLSTSNVSFIRNEATGDEATDGGGAIYFNGSSGTLEDTVFETNQASGTSGSGGAVFVNGTRSAVEIASSTFLRNTSSRAGGAIENRDGALTLTDTDFTTNDAGTNPGNGGALHLSGSGTASIEGGTVSRNSAVEGGGFWNSSAEMMVEGTTFTDNVASGAGTADRIQGGGALFNNGGQLVIVDVTATDNSAVGASGSGGAILNSGGSTWVISSTISDNVARRAGGGLEDVAGTAVLVMSTFDGNSVVEDANPGNGGGVHSGGGLTVVAGGVYTNNRAVEGGGLWTSGTLAITSDEADVPVDGMPDVVMPTITAPTISMNEATGDDADQGGGGLYATPSGEIIVFDAEVSMNVASGASGSGGGIFSAGALTVTDASITGNVANRAGGGIEDAGGTVELVDATLTDNSIGTPAPGNGGGLHSGGGDVTIVRGVIARNTAVEGGGLWSNGTLTINGGAEGDRDDDEDAAEGDRSDFTSIVGNEATGAAAGTGGGGLYVESGGVASVRYVLIEENSASGAAGSGGGVFVADDGMASLAYTEITGNAANRAGAGIELFDDTATDAETSVSLRQVLVADNAIDVGAPGNGGGLHVGGAGTVEVEMSTFAGNDAVEGGGLWINGAGSLVLENSTVSGNTAVNDGGGVYDNGGATFSLSSVTVASNDAGGDGGGLFSASPDAFTVRNTLIGDNMADGAGPDCFGTFQSGGYNLIEDVSACTFTGNTATNITGADPALAPLADNGGFTPTRALAPSSRAVDSGDSAFDLDQRGLARFAQTTGQDDIGAFELFAAPVDTGDDPTAAAFGIDPPRPNPAVGSVRVSFHVADTAPVELALFNTLGQRVLTVFEGQATPSGMETVDLDVRGLAAGVYVLRLQNGDATAARTITVVR
jgi:CSLREA domain-containing protein